MWLGEKITEYASATHLAHHLREHPGRGFPNRLMQAVDSVRAGSLGVLQIALIPGDHDRGRAVVSSS